MNFEDYSYKYPTLKAIEKKYHEFEESIKNATSKEEVFKTINKEFKFSDKIESAVQVLFIRFQCDTRDAKIKKLVNKYNVEAPLISQISDHYSDVLLNSPFLEDVKAKYGDLYIRYLENAKKCFSKDIIEDLQIENDLTMQYDELMASGELEFRGEKLSISQLSKFLGDKDRDTRIEAAKLVYGFYESIDDQIGEIYSKLVKVRDTIAKKLGFENFTPLGYLRLNRLDYNAEMVKSYREQIKKDVVPLTIKLRKKQAARLNIKNPIFLDYNVNFLSGNATPKGTNDELVDYAKKMYSEMSPETDEFFNFMIEHHLMDLNARPGKSAGGFMTLIPEHKAPFIFANSNGSSSDVDTLTHEVGHAFQGYMCAGIKVPSYRMATLETSEIHSMSMEFFAYPWMELFFKEDTEKYEYAHLSDAINFLPYGALVDEFQHWVYENVDATHAERCAKWKELDAIYRPWISFKGFPYLEKGTIWIRQSHIFSTAFYYIDYTLAQVCALQFKNLIDKDFNKAWKKYMKLVKMGGKYTFTELLRRDGLKVPFNDGVVKNTIKPQMKKILSIDDTKF